MSNPREIENKPDNYTTDINNSKPDSRLSTFVKDLKQLQQIYSVKPLEYTDIVGEYWQRINDLIYTLGLTENDSKTAYIGWTVPIIGKQRSSLVSEELGTLNTRNNTVISPASPEDKTNDKPEGNLVADTGNLKDNGVRKEKAHKYGLIQSIDTLLQRNIDTWGDLYIYFFNNKKDDTPPRDLAELLFDTLDISEWNYYYNYLTKKGVMPELKKIIDTFGNGLYNLYNPDTNSTDLSISGLLFSESSTRDEIIEKFENVTRHLPENGKSISFADSIIHLQENTIGLNLFDWICDVNKPIEKILFNSFSIDNFTNEFNSLTTKGIIPELNKLITTFGVNFYNWLYTNTAHPKSLEELIFGLDFNDENAQELYDGIKDYLTKGIIGALDTLIGAIGEDLIDYFQQENCIWANTSDKIISIQEMLFDSLEYDNRTFKINDIKYNLILNDDYIPIKVEKNITSDDTVTYDIDTVTYNNIEYIVDDVVKTFSKSYYQFIIPNTDDNFGTYTVDIEKEDTIKNITINKINITSKDSGNININIDYQYHVDLTWCDYIKGLKSKGIISELYNIVNFLGDTYNTYVNNIYNPDPENPYNPDVNPLYVLGKIGIGEVLYGNKNKDNETTYETDYILKTAYICEDEDEVNKVTESLSDQKTIFNSFYRIAYDNRTYINEGNSKIKYLIPYFGDFDTAITNLYNFKNKNIFFKDPYYWTTEVQTNSNYWKDTSTNNDTHIASSNAIVIEYINTSINDDYSQIVLNDSFNSDKSSASVISQQYTISSPYTTNAIGNEYSDFVVLDNDVEENIIEPNADTAPILTLITKNDNTTYFKYNNTYYENKLFLKKITVNNDRYIFRDSNGNQTKDINKVAYILLYYGDDVSKIATDYTIPHDTYILPFSTIAKKSTIFKNSVVNSEKYNNKTIINDPIITNKKTILKKGSILKKDSIIYTGVKIFINDDITKNPDIIINNNGNLRFQFDTTWTYFNYIFDLTSSYLYDKLYTGNLYKKYWVYTQNNSTEAYPDILDNLGITVSNSSQGNIREMNSWALTEEGTDKNKKYIIKLGMNSLRYTGFLSFKQLKNYYFSSRMVSDTNDDDAIGIILGGYKDSNSYFNTLALIQSYHYTSIVIKNNDISWVRLHSNLNNTKNYDDFIVLTPSIEGKLYFSTSGEDADYYVTDGIHRYSIQDNEFKIGDNTYYVNNTNIKFRDETIYPLTKTTAIVLGDVIYYKNGEKLCCGESEYLLSGNTYSVTGSLNNVDYSCTITEDLTTITVGTKIYEPTINNAELFTIGGKSYIIFYNNKYSLNYIEKEISSGTTYTLKNRTNTLYTYRYRTNGPSNYSDVNKYVTINKQIFDLTTTVNNGMYDIDKYSNPDITIQDKENWINVSKCLEALLYAIKSNYLIYRRSNNDYDKQNYNTFDTCSHCIPFHYNKPAFVLDTTDAYYIDENYGNVYSFNDNTTEIGTYTPASGDNPATIKIGSDNYTISVDELGNRTILDNNSEVVSYILESEADNWWNGINNTDKSNILNSLKKIFYIKKGSTELNDPSDSELTIIFKEIIFPRFELSTLIFDENHKDKLLLDDIFKIRYTNSAYHIKSRYDNTDIAGSKICIFGYGVLNCYNKHNLNLQVNVIKEYNEDNHRLIINYYPFYNSIINLKDDAAKAELKTGTNIYNYSSYTDTGIAYLREYHSAYKHLIYVIENYKTTITQEHINRYGYSDTLNYEKTLSNNDNKKILRTILDGYSSYGYIACSNPLSSFLENDIIDLDNPSIYNLAENKKITKKYTEITDSNYSGTYYKVEDSSENITDMYSTIKENYHVGRLLTNDITENTYFLRGDSETIQLVVKKPKIKLNENQGFYYNALDELSNYIIKSYSPTNFVLTSGNQTLTANSNGDLIWTGNAMEVTSDERKKCDIALIPDNVLDAWNDVNWYQFRFKDDKSVHPQYHTGLIAQRINEIFKKYNLNATDYGLVHYDDLIDFWTVRYAEAQAIEAAYQRKRTDMLEKKIEQLEKVIQLIAKKAKIKI